MRVVVVGAGIAGLAAAFRLDERARRDGTPLELTVLEAGERAGGHATTVRDAGWLIEAGPHAFVHRASEPRVMELVQALGLEPELIEPSPLARRRYVFHRGRLRQVPGSPFALIGSDALSARGKLRLMLEPWAPAAREGGEETVADFARRRLGDEVARVLVDPVMAGISAGDSGRLSASASFPALVE
ncbi:MAG TPA: protoporphyrinogen oxidase, partial [Candidatus Eisenbacteria bacterium]|nr:protoporphyrinogen oxidase [Candidatus Eisenbacteria bacterium]